MLNLGFAAMINEISHALLSKQSTVELDCFPVGQSLPSPRLFLSLSRAFYIQCYLLEKKTQIFFKKGLKKKVLLKCGVVNLPVLTPTEVSPLNSTLWLPPELPSLSPP